MYTDVHPKGFPWLHDSASSNIDVQITSPLAGMRSIVISVPVCLCLSACMSQEPHVQTSQIFCTYCRWLCLSPNSLTTELHVVYFHFLWSTSCFHLIELQAVGELFTVTHQVAPEAVSSHRSPSSYVWITWVVTILPGTGFREQCK